jgi:hypothetical protein
MKLNYQNNLIFKVEIKKNQKLYKKRVSDNHGEHVELIIQDTIPG